MIVFEKFLREKTFLFGFFGKRKKRARLRSYFRCVRSGRCLFFFPRTTTHGRSLCFKLRALSKSVDKCLILISRSNLTKGAYFGSVKKENKRILCDVATKSVKQRRIELNSDF